MSYLSDFAATFTEQELIIFKHFDLRGKVESLRDIYLREHKKTALDELSIRKHLAISQTHLDKLNSLLLDKTITAMFGNDYDRAFFVILQKGLSDLMLHELKILERQLLRQKNEGTLESFYKAAFDNLRRMYHPNYDSTLTHQFGSKYLQSLGSAKTLADESYVAMTTLHADILASHRAGNEESDKGQMWVKLENWANKIGPSGNYEAKLYYTYALITFRKNMGNSVEEFLQACESAYETYEKCGDNIDKRLKGVILSELAFGYTESNRFAEAEKYYSMAMNEFPDSIGLSIFHIGNYILICLINENYKSAFHAFNTKAVIKIQANANPSMMLDVYILGILTHLHNGQYEEAFKYINAMNNYRKSEVTEYGKAILRVLHPLYFAIRSDFNTAAILAKSSDKYLGRAVKKVSAFSYYFRFNKILAKIVNCKLDGGKTDKFRAEIDALQKGFYEVNNILLRRLL